MDLIDELDLDKVSGVLTITGWDRQGNVVESYTDQNVILNNAAEIYRDLVSGLVDARITYLGFGDLGRLNTDLSPVPNAQNTDPGLVNELGRVTAVPSRITLNNYPCIVYTAILDYGDLNGSTYNMLREYSLITADGRAYNKKNRAPLIKSSEYRYEFKWTLEYRA